jgi:hypothetical protein
MRAIFGVLALVVVVAIVGVLMKKQLGTHVTPTPAQTGQPGATVPALTGTPQQQVKQFEQAVQGAMQQPRPMPDESK